MQFVENPQIIILDRTECQVKPLADLLVGLPLGDEMQDFEFAVGERLYDFRSLVCDCGSGNGFCRFRESIQYFVHIAEQRIGSLFFIR